MTDAAGSAAESKVLYVVSLIPEEAYDAKFNEWYDHEHVPELLRCPGFESATRFSRLEGITGAPAYLALYSITSMDAFKTEQYLRQANRTDDELSPLAREVRAHRSLDLSAKYRQILHRNREG